MEVRARYVQMGIFTLAVLALGFGFVYWLNNAGGFSNRVVYQGQFEGPVSGLLRGSAVLFNGIRVGEVTALELDPAKPRQVQATIAIDSGTPVRKDTEVSMDFQGLTGVPVIALEGGQQPGASGSVPTLIAEAGAGQSMTQAARDALRRVDAVLADNAEPLKTTIANLQVFSEGLARNTGKLDGIIMGLERMTGGGTSTSKVTYDLRAARTFPGTSGKILKGELVVPEPTAVAMLETQRFLFSPANEAPEFANVMWADSIPKLLQARLLESFENYDIAHAPLRSMDGVQADYQLLIDVRRFQITIDPEPVADIELSARILDKDGKVVASRLFQEAEKFDKIDPPTAATAFNDAFVRIARDIVAWTVDAL